jgi:hypothetical protein
MTNIRKIVFAPHDDGSGAFAVLFRLARALLHVANGKGYELNIYFLNSSVAADGQIRLDSLLSGLCDRYQHQAVLVPTDNLIWLPKDKDTATVMGGQIPGLLRNWIRPLWYHWPATPAWIQPDLPVRNREDWINNREQARTVGTKEIWEEKVLAWWGEGKLTPQWWQDVTFGISMGVPQLHRIAHQEGFPSIEVGDWFFSVGLRGCMQESSVTQEVIASTEPDLQMIKEDEFQARESWLTLYQAPHEEYKEHLENSPVKFNEMQGLLWTGDPPPDLQTWKLAIELRRALDADLSDLRGGQAKHIGYIVPGTTPVWKGILESLRRRKITDFDQIALLDLNRGKSTVTLIENGGQILERASQVLQTAQSEEMHLALCRASDLGITRTAGGVLGFAETQRPSILIDEPGHWLGRIQRDQCREAGLCVVVPLAEFIQNPGGTIQRQADRLNTDSELDHVAARASELKVGVELDLAEYFFNTYIEHSLKR